MLRPFGIFSSYGNFVVMWYMYVFSPVLVYCTKKNLVFLVEGDVCHIHSVNENKHSRSLFS
jgi:hypothetical protein